MQISRSKTALSVLLVSFLGVRVTGAQTQNSPEFPQLEDGFGETNYGYQCYQRIYLKSSLYAAAKHFCDSVKVHPELKSQGSENAGYQNKLPDVWINKIIRPFAPAQELFIIPVLESGVLFPYSM